jgi:hypothetical protein
LNIHNLATNPKNSKNEGAHTPTGNTKNSIFTVSIRPKIIEIAAAGRVGRNHDGKGKNGTIC